MSRSFFALSSLLALAALVGAHPGHHHALARRLTSGTPTASASNTWYHPDDSQYHQLFRRGPVTDGIQYPTVGSPEWSAAYPSSTPTAVPQAWTDALNAAVSAGKIPQLAPSTLVNGAPAYASGIDPNVLPVCSATWKCKLQQDVWDAPDGVLGISFDDGPIAQSSDTLYAFLQQNQVPATHFFIGVNIIENWNEFNVAFNMGGDIAVHTWTHPYMTSLTNDQVVAQLGWTMEVIHNSTGGRLPRFWRPPFGDSDARVSAIAREVFGLTTVIWNHDTEDWSMATTSLTITEVEGNLTQWYSGPKSPGLIILEHELTNNTVAAFINTYPSAVSNGWKPVSVAQLDGLNTPYQNAQGSTGAVTPVNDILVDASPSSAAASPSSPAAGSPSASGAALQAKTSTVTVAPSGSAGAAGAAASGTKTSGASTRFSTSFAAVLVSLLLSSAVFAA